MSMRPLSAPRRRLPPAARWSVSNRPPDPRVSSRPRPRANETVGTRSAPSPSCRDNVPEHRRQRGLGDRSADGGLPARQSRLGQYGAVTRFVFTTLRGYERSWLKADFLGALTVWAILAPEALATAGVA